MRYLVFIIALFAALQTNAQNNIVYGAGINYTNGAPTFTPPVRTSRVAIDTVTGKWYHFNTPGGWQLIGNTIEEIAGCTAPAYIPGKGDSRLVINNCVKPEVYWYNGTVWKWINEGTTYFPGEGIRIENDTIILDSLNFLDFRTGNALDGDVGRVQWNDTDGTLDLNLKGGNVTLQIGQEEVTLVKHADNSGLIEGRVVYVVGSDGANKTVRYAKADSDATSATTFGLMTESASGGNKAFCTTFGLVRNLNTTNLTEGGIVWLSADTAGTMTAVRPTAPDHGVMIGFCIRKHATQGAIFVQVQNGYELNELHDVFVPSPTNGQVLTWNSTNARWEAITPANQLQTLSTDNTPGNISISSGNTITLNVNDADASTTNELQTLSLSGSDLSISGGNTVTLPATGLTGNGISPFIAQYNSTNTLDTTGIVWNGGRMGVGLTTTSPSARFHVRGQGNTSTTWTAQFHNSAGNNNALMIRDDGNVGVGTNAPTQRLETRGATSDNTASAFRASNSNAQNLFSVRNDSELTIGIANYLYSYNDATGVNTRTPAGGLIRLSYSAAGATGSGYGFFIANGQTTNRDYTSGDGGGFRLGEGYAPTSGTGTYNSFLIGATINQTGGANGITRGILIAPTLTAAADYRAIQYNNNSGWGIYGNGTAKSYFAGNVAIGTTAQNASAAFEVASTTQGILFPRMTTAQRDLIATPADGLVIYNTSTNKLQVRAAGAWVDLH